MIAGRNAESHNIHFGVTNPPEFRANQISTIFHPGPLKPGTTYFWCVYEVTENEVVPGKLWTFRTQVTVRQ